MRNQIQFAGAITLLLVTACASSGATRSNNPQDKIARAEIDRISASNAYDVVSRLHPNWLRPSASAGVMSTVGSKSAVGPSVAVYLDGVRLGGPGTLKTVSSSSVSSIEFMNATRAATVLHDLGGVPSPDYVIIVDTK